MTRRNRGALTEARPSLEQDAAQHWVLVGASVPIGLADGQLDPGCLGGGAPVLRLVHDSDWFVEPTVESVDAVTIEGSPLRGRVHLRAGLRIDAQGGDVSFQFGVAT